MRDVVLSSNDRGTDYLLVTAFSLLRHYRGQEPIRLNVLDGYGGLSEANRSRVRELIARFPPATVRFLSIEPLMDGLKDRLTGGGRWNVFAWSSILGPDLVADATGNLLYLDIDQLVNADVSPLFELDLGNDLLAAVYENHRQHGTKDSREWDTGVLPEEAERYLNVGTMVFNTELFRREGVRQKIVDWYLAHRDIATRIDQDAFNAVCWNRVRPLSMAWGFHDRMMRKFVSGNPFARYWFGNSPIECLDAALNPRIFHFMGKKKPWAPSHRPYRKLYHAVMREAGLTPPREELLSPLHDFLNRRVERKLRARLARMRTVLSGDGTELRELVRTKWQGHARARRWKRGILLPFEWLGLCSCIILISVLPRRMMQGFFDLLSRVYFAFDSKGRRLALANLRLIRAVGGFAVAPAAPMTERERKILRRSYRNMSRAIGYAFWTFVRAKKRCSATGEMGAACRSFLAANKPVVTVSGHLGCWEILSQLAFLEGHRMMSVAKDVGTWGVTALLMRARRSIGQDIVPAAGAFRPLMRGIRDGKSLGLLVDQKVSPRDGGIWVRFLGRPMPVSAAPAFFAAKAKAPILVAWSRPLAGGRYRCEFVDTIGADEARDIRATTQRISTDLERIVRRHPSCWVLNYEYFSHVPDAADVRALGGLETAEGRV